MSEDAGGKDSAPRIKFGETELVEEKLDGSPRIELQNEETLKIAFGNTGFEISFRPRENTFDYIPENRLIPPKGSGRKYASILSVSFLELHKLINNPEKMKELDLQDTNVTKISASTNPVLVNAITNLFAQSDTPDIAVANEENDRVKIDLQKFKDLDNEDPLIIYLNRVADRAKDETVTYDKPVKMTFT